MPLLRCFCRFNPFHATRLFYTPWKYQKTRGFFMFSRGMERAVAWIGLTISVIPLYTLLSSPALKELITFYHHGDIRCNSSSLLVVSWWNSNPRCCHTYLQWLQKCYEGLLETWELSFLANAASFESVSDHFET